MSLFVKTQVQKKMEECVMEAITHSVEVLSKEYGFDMKEGLSLVLGSSSGLNVNKSLNVKKSLIMCFDERNVKSDGCNGLKYNGGLFTQCDGKVTKDDYCESCSKEAMEHGKPLCGTVKERMEMGSEFKDSKGRKAIKYLTYLKKEKKSVEEAKESASSEGWYLPESEVSDVKVVKEKRGRPKKDVKEVAAEKVVDIFACMVEEVSTSTSTVEEKESSDDDMLNELTESMVKLSVEKKPTAASEKKAQEKALKEQEKLLKEQEKALKEQEKLLEKEKKAQEKALKEQEKKNKEQEKEKKAQEKALKEQEKKNKEEEKEKKAAVAVVEEKVKVQVSKFTYEGKEYYKTSNNLVYDPVTKEEVGIYCDETKTIKELPDDSDSEIEEEEYDE